MISSLPFLAGVSGLAFGSVLIVILMSVVGRRVAVEPELAMVLTLVTVLGELLVSFLVLLGVRAVAPEGLVWFGIAMGTGFIVGLGVLAAKLMKQV